MSTTSGSTGDAVTRAATITREWSSRKSRISTSDPSFRRQWVTSACQHSFGSAASNRMQELWGRLFGSWSMNPRRARMRQMVETDGTSERRLERCQWMVRAPASNPSSTRCLRRTMISSSTSPEVRLGLVWALLDRGASAS